MEILRSSVFSRSTGKYGQEKTPYFGHFSCTVDADIFAVAATVHISWEHDLVNGMF